ncbi:MAG TPA: tRNA lysidine(34) synthetase TilS [Gemmatimonadaceae bacterium]|jgi:tRNA(Ile)-lysidine synthase|nr:tRNA lysidine(34) synthetase TilS [Gemmatimonadaceae bacterium]
MSIPAVEASKVESAVAAALDSCDRAVLAVSGGLDSMTLLTAASRLPLQVRRNVVVATFDHGTGPAAGRAAALVARYSARCGFACVSGRASTIGTREEEWRRSRWEFLHDVAAQRGAVVVTAHTRDDQIETVFIRILRDAGPRGLAGLYADSDIIRPFLDVSRATLASYAKLRRIPFVDDPSNRDRKHLRNRIRLDILPTIVARKPGFSEELLALAREAANWRRSLEALAGNVDAEPDTTGGLRISRSSLQGYNAEALRVLWPALAAKASVVMDRRGTHRAAEFTIRGVTGGTIQLSGGVEIVMRRDHMLLRRMPTGARKQAGLGEMRA